MKRRRRASAVYLSVCLYVCLFAGASLSIHLSIYLLCMPYAVSCPDAVKRRRRTSCLRCCARARASASTTRPPLRRAYRDRNPSHDHKGARPRLNWRGRDVEMMLLNSLSRSQGRDAQDDVEGTEWVCKKYCVKGCVSGCLSVHCVCLRVSAFVYI